MAGGPRRNSGPKPTPVPLIELRGNPGRRPIPKIIRAAEFTGGAPLWIGSYALEFWDTYAPIYRRLGLLTQLSLPAFVLLCDAWQEYRLLREDIEQNGRTHVTPNLGEIARPQIGMLKAAFERFRVMAAEFGIGPASLTRIRAEGPGGVDPVEAYRQAKTRPA